MFKTVAYQLLFLVLTTAASLHAQIKTPQPSPASKVQQTIGMTNVEVEYSRPGMKGRKIFAADGLVPYGKLWRTGANKNTIITFDKPVRIDGKELAAGSYALFTKPSANEWEVYFYKDANNWGTPREWDDSKVAATYKARSKRMPTTTSNFNIYFDELTNNSGNLMMVWENTGVAVPIEVLTRDEASKSIERVMAGPSANDYYNAASYYFDEKINLEQAYEWIKRANKLNGKEPKYWMLRRQALIEAALGNKKAAINSANLSMIAAKKAGNMDYVRMNEKSIREWSR